MIYGRQEKKYVASKQRVLCSKNQWKRIENHHKAIIDVATYLAVQDKLNNQDLFN